MSNEIDFNELEGVTEGDKLTVRFKPEASEDLIYVAAMVRAGVIRVSYSDMHFLDTVRASGDWKQDASRTREFVVGPSWSRSFFEGRMSRALESLEVGRLH